jgi:hypothetical protein
MQHLHRSKDSLQNLPQLPANSLQTAAACSRSLLQAQVHSHPNQNSTTQQCASTAFDPRSPTSQTCTAVTPSVPQINLLVKPCLSQGMAAVLNLTED